MISIQNLSKRFGKVTALDGINLEIEKIFAWSPSNNAKATEDKASCLRPSCQKRSITAERAAINCGSAMLTCDLLES